MTSTNDASSNHSELNVTPRLAKGEHKVQIRHVETNTTTSRPIIELTNI